MFCALLMTPSLMANEPMVITTWNIEHLGSPGRGFGGGFGGFGRYATPPRKDQLPKRTDEQLKKIAVYYHGGKASLTGPLQSNRKQVCYPACCDIDFSVPQGHAGLWGYRMLFSLPGS